MASSRRTGTNENIRTYGNGTRQYTSLATWENDTDNNLVTATTTEVLECYNDAVFDDSVVISGATTDTSYFRIIRPASGQGHSGKPGTGVQFTSASLNCFQISEHNFQIQDIVVDHSTNNASAAAGINVSGNPQGVHVIGCISKSLNAGAGASRAFYLISSVNDTRFVNCLGYDSKSYGFFIDGAGTKLLYNCTSIGNGISGFHRQGGTATVINCLSKGNTTSDFAGTMTASFNASGDGTASGTGSRTSQTFRFVDEAAKDFHLHQYDAGGWSRGTNLAGDATFPFNDDIDKQTTNYMWSMGFDFHSTVPSARRVGVNEHISTFGNGTRNYTDISVWESDFDNDLVATTTTEVLECYNDSASFSLGGGVTFSGATTNANYFRIIRPAAGQGHNGTPSIGVKFTGTGTILNVAERNFVAHDLILGLTCNNPSTDIEAARFTTGGGGAFVALIVDTPVNTNTAGTIGLGSISAATGACHFINCLVISSEGPGFSTAGGAGNYLYNCTSVSNTTYGFVVPSGTTVVKNCLATGNGTADFSGSFSALSNHNSSGDTSAPGSRNRTSQTFTFANSASKDYHLSSLDLGARGRGINLDKDSQFPFYDDIDGNTIGSVWSCGIDYKAPTNSRRRGVNENYSTYGGGSRNYTSLATWESATDNNLTEICQTEVLECFADSATYSDRIAIAGGSNATTSTSYFRIIRAALGHENQGIVGRGVRFVQIPNGTGAFSLGENNFHLYDTAHSWTDNSASSKIAVYMPGSTSGTVLVGVLTHDIANSGAGAGIGINSAANTLNVVAVNCVSLRCKSQGIAFTIGGADTTSMISNCVSRNNGSTGINISSNGFIRNCISVGNTPDYGNASLVGASNNLSSDSTAPGSNNRRLQSPTFVSVSGDDYHLDRTDESARGYGRNMSSDSIFSYDDDIDKEYIGPIWSMGIDHRAYTSARRRGNNENISTYGNGTRQYTSLGTWESATDNDLVATTVSEVLELYNDAVFNDTVTLAGSTTSSTYFRIIRPAIGQRHNGTQNTGVRFASTSTSSMVFNIQESNVVIQDLVITASGNTASNYAGIYLQSVTTGTVTIVGCIVYNITNSGAGAGYGFLDLSSTPSTYIVNCLARNCKTAGFSTTNGSGTVYFYNCNAINNPIGFNRSGGTAIAKNCISSGNSSAGFSGSFNSASFANASADATAVGSSPKINQTFIFADTTINDYHIKPMDALVRGFGVDLSADSTFPFDDDIDREYIYGTWSIGADYKTPSARRRGLNEHISTYGNGTRDYSSLSVWEAATDLNLVTLKQSEVLEVYRDSDSYNDSVQVDGTTTDANYFRIIRAASAYRHKGNPGAGIVFAPTTLTSNNAFGLGENYFHIQDIEITYNVNSASNSAAVNFLGGNTRYCQCVGVLITSPINSGAGTANGFVFASGVISAKLIDCLAAVCDTGYNANSSATAFWYNCIAAGNTTGFLRGSTADITVKNCISTGNTTGFSGTFNSNSCNNASADATAPGTNSRTTQTFSFRNAAASNYHLRLNDTGAKDFGVDLTKDTTFAFNDDIDGHLFVTWDIGYDEIAGVGRGVNAKSRISTRVGGILV